MQLHQESPVFPVTSSDESAYTVSEAIHVGRTTF